MAEPLVKDLPRQAMLRGRLPRLNGELAKAFRLVLDVLAAAETIDRKPHSLIERTGLKLHGMLDAVGIRILNSAALHQGHNSIFAICSPERTWLPAGYAARRTCPRSVR